MERWSISAALDSRGPVITTLNLAGHSSSPLIEHLNLTRCYCWSRRLCQVLTNRRIVPDHHGTLLSPLLSHACCRSQEQLPAPSTLRGKLKSSLKVTKENLISPHHSKDASPACFLSCCTEEPFWGIQFTFPLCFPTATTRPLTSLQCVTPGLAPRDFTSRC